MTNCDLGVYETLCSVDEASFPRARLTGILLDVGGCSSSRGRHGKLDPVPVEEDACRRVWSPDTHSHVRISHGVASPILILVRVRGVDVCDRQDTVSNTRTPHKFRHSASTTDSLVVQVTVESKMFLIEGSGSTWSHLVLCNSDGKLYPVEVLLVALDNTGLIIKKGSVTPTWR